MESQNEILKALENKNISDKDKEELLSSFKAIEEAVQKKEVFIVRV
jgi:hypothetical protein